MRVVADTNVVVSGLFWRGNQHRLLEAARDGLIQLFTSAALLEELDDVLGREKFAARLRAAGATRRELVSGYAALAALVEPEKIVPTVIEDPDDDNVLACAVAAGCEVIVSGDSHLLRLKQYEQLRILTAAELLAEIKVS